MGKGVEQIFLKEEYKWLISPWKDAQHH
jgi:hypothetical protein